MFRRYKKKKRIVKTLSAVLLSCLLLLSAQGVSHADEKLGNAKPEAYVPEGYNENDYLKLVSFLEYSEPRDESNGLKLTDDYDPAVPETWCGPVEDVRGGSMPVPSIIWREIGGEKRLVHLDLPFMRGFCGRLDLSGCSELEYLCFRDNAISELDVSDCKSLVSLICYRNDLENLDISSCSELEALAFQENRISQIDVSNNRKLYSLCCDGNGITALDVTNNPELKELRCENNALASLDLSNNPKLSWLWTCGNPIKELDLSSNPQLCLSTIQADGEGTVSYYGNEFHRSVFAETSSELPFKGWFSRENGQLISSDSELTLDASSPDDLIAVFGGNSTKGGNGAARPSAHMTLKAHSSPLIYIIIGCAAAAVAAVCAAAAHRKRKNKLSK